VTNAADTSLSELGTPTQTARHGAGAPFLLVLPLVAVLAIFFLGPLAWNFGESLTFGGRAPSVGQYLRVLTDPYYVAVIAQTLLLAVAVTLGTLLLGYPLAFAVARSHGWVKSALIFVVVAPLLINVVVRSYGWMVILGNSGVINSLLKMMGFAKLELMYNWGAVAIALIQVLLPFMVLAVSGTIETIDRTLEEAATTLGASRRAVLRHVVLPLSRDGILAGSILVFTLTVGSFVTVMLLGDTSTMVMPLLIYQQLTVVSDWPFAGAMGTVLLAVVVAVLWLQARGRRAPA
jgi:putative spermidine/putrescine transport system permease protein